MYISPWWKEGDVLCFVDFTVSVSTSKRPLASLSIERSKLLLPAESIKSMRSIWWTVCYDPKPFESVRLKYWVELFIKSLAVHHGLSTDRNRSTRFFAASFFKSDFKFMEKTNSNPYETTDSKKRLKNTFQKPRSLPCNLLLIRTALRFVESEVTLSL